MSDEKRIVRISNGEVLRRAEERRIQETPAKRASYMRQIRALIRRHSNVLVMKYRDATVYNEYGTADFSVDKWSREKNKFVTQVLERAVPKGWISQLEREINSSIDEIVSTLCHEATALETALDDGAITPYEFELHCADKLKACGWRTVVTKGSGDQGVDVIVRRGSITVALQCKFYTGAVGNAAVQEVLAGKAYIGATHAAVITNARYTAAARRLAAATKVLLLHLEDLPFLHDKVTAV